MPPLTFAECPRLWYIVQKSPLKPPYFRSSFDLQSEELRVFKSGLYWYYRGDLIVCQAFLSKHKKIYFSGTDCNLWQSLSQSAKKRKKTVSFAPKNSVAGKRFGLARFKSLDPPKLTLISIYVKQEADIFLRLCTEVAIASKT